MHFFVHNLSLGIELLREMLAIDNAFGVTRDGLRCQNRAFQRTTVKLGPWNSTVSIALFQTAV